MDCSLGVGYYVIFIIAIYAGSLYIYQNGAWSNYHRNLLLNALAYPIGVATSLWGWMALPLGAIIYIPLMLTINSLVKATSQEQPRLSLPKSASTLLFAVFFFLGRFAGLGVLPWLGLIIVGLERTTFFLKLQRF